MASAIVRWLSMCAVALRPAVQNTGRRATLMLVFCKGFHIS
jgi:hypothetical protein